MPHASNDTKKVWTRLLRDDDIERCHQVINQAYDTDIEIIFSPFPPELTTGLVLEHEERGIIGCAVWNKETNHISSISVLPEFRGDSLRLVDGLMHYAAENMPDQYFKAELLEKNAYPLVKMMALRGQVDLVEGGVSHYLDDVPCIAVEMKPSAKTIERFQKQKMESAVDNAAQELIAMLHTQEAPTANGYGGNPHTPVAAADGVPQIKR